MDIFNNRELAIILWLLVIAVYLSVSSKMADVRKTFREVLSAFFVKQIVSVFLLMIAYIAALVYFLAEWDLWNIEQLKNTVLWSLSVGLLSLIQLESIKKDKSFFKHSVIDNLKLLAILQFIIGVYTFSFLVEVTLVPILALVGAILAITETDKKFHQVKTFLEYSLSFFGVILIVYTVYMLITNFSEFGNEKNIYDFFLPPLLTLGYLPFVFIMLVYSTYEQVFIRLKFTIKRRVLRRLAKLYALIVFNVRMALLERWSHRVVRFNIETHDDLIDSFRYIFRVRAAEKNPKEIPIELGWSPYKAKGFLLSKGLITGCYEQFYEEEWFASSRIEEFGAGIIPNNVAYYVEGSEEIANILKVKVNVNDLTSSQKAREKLVDIAEALSFSSLNQSLTAEMENAITKGKSYSEKCGSKSISLVVENSPKQSFKFTISSF